MPIRPYHRWDHESGAVETFTVLPDGCRDLLLITNPDGSTHWRLTDWDFRPRRVTISAGTKMTGYRIRPGVLINPDRLQDCMTSASHPLDALDFESRPIGDIIAELAGEGGTLAKAARSVGVSPRSLQRKFQIIGYPPPSFWQLLGRARRAAAALDANTGLADLAHEAGYSDQSHMTRAFRHWFGLSPARIAGDLTWRAAFRQPGLGTWTGEHISIR